MEKRRTRRARSVQRKCLSFSIDPGSPKTLTDQVEEGLRVEIASGSFRVGDLLPSRLLLSQELKVSECVVRAALSRLAADHLLVGHQGRGYGVRGIPPKRFSPTVLDVNVEPWYSFGPSVSLFECSKTLSAAGCRVFTMPLGGGARDVPYLYPLKEALRGRPDLVILRSCLSRRANALKLVMDSGCRFLTVGSEKAAGRHARYLGNLRYDYGEAIASFVADCRRARVRSVLQFDFGRNSYLNAEPALTEAGIAVERLNLPINGPHDLDELVRDAYSVLSRRLDAGRLPDLILLTDDYLAEGAYGALRARSVSVPGHVRLVSFSNAKSGLAHRGDMAQFVFDPFRDGRTIAECALEWFRTGRLGDYACPAVYRRGASFPVR